MPTSTGAAFPQPLPPTWNGQPIPSISQPVQQSGFFGNLVPQTNTPLWGPATGNFGGATTAGGPGNTSPGGFNVNPGPVSGTNPFGYIPGPVGLPNPAGDLNTQLGGGLPGLNNQISGDILNQLQGRLSPETLAQIQDFGAQYGQASGMPGGGLGRNRTLRDLGRSVEDQQNRGISNYNATIPTISRTQTVDPASQIALAQWNAINRSAPDPTQAASYAKQLFDQYLAKMRGPGGGNTGGYGPSGGTGAYQGPTAPTGPAGFGFNDLAPGTGDPYAQDMSWLDELDPSFYDGTDTGSYSEPATDPYASGIDYAGGTGYDPMAGFGDLGF